MRVAAFVIALLACVEALTLQQAVASHPIRVHRRFEPIPSCEQIHHCTSEKAQSIAKKNSHLIPHFQPGFKECPC
jgi:hypothetical protein